MCSFRALLSLREYEASMKRPLVKIMSLVHNCRMVEVYTMEKFVRVLRNLGIVVFNPNRPFMFFQPCFQGSVSQSILYEIAINAAGLVNNTSALQGKGLSFSLGKHVRRTLKAV